MSADDDLMALVEEYAARAARAERRDVVDYLVRAGDDAGRLADLFDAFLARAPADPDPDPQLVSRLQALADAEFEQPSEPALLALRHRDGLTVDRVVEGLGDELSLGPAHRARLRVRYQDLEGGRLPMAGVAPALRAALARVLRVAEERLVGTRTLLEGPVFARAPEGWEPSSALLEDVLPDAPDDTVDRLFGADPTSSAGAPEAAGR